MVYSDDAITVDEARAQAAVLAAEIKSESNVSVVPLFISGKEMARRGGLAAELRDREVILRR